jgi:hypothetical protein
MRILFIKQTFAMQANFFEKISKKLHILVAASHQKYFLPLFWAFCANWYGARIEYFYGKYNGYKYT